jgi:hypothetical protein
MTSQTYARGGDEQARAGGVILAAISVLSAVLVIAGLAYATGTGARHKAALAAAGCEPNLSPSGLQCTTYQVLTAQYTAIVNTATQQLATGAAAYTANQNRLAAAEAALVSILATQKTLDSKLAAFPFPPAAAPAASQLLHATQALAGLTARQARSTSLTRLRSYNHRADAASATVQTDIALLHKALDTPPTVAQEP